jgi:phage terminase large subunit-like protein
MNEPTKLMLRLLADGKLRHGGNPVLRWMASNLAGRIDPAGNIKPDKEKSADKIDGMVALIMALGRASTVPNNQPSISFL